MSTANTVGGTDTIGHSSVQAWSAGDIFPAVITVVECYRDDGRNENAIKSLGERYRWTAYDLTLDGQTERYSTYEDAAAAARFILADPEVREAWAAGAAFDE